MTPKDRGGRIVVAIVMGGTAFALAVLLVAAVGLEVTVAPVVAALVGAGLLAVWLARRKASVRSGWSRGCLVNSLLSAGAAVGLQAQNDLWSGRSQYAEDLDRAIGPLTHFIWALAARAGLVVLILAVVLFALSYWLLGPPHRKA